MISYLTRIIIYLTANCQVFFSALQLLDVQDGVSVTQQVSPVSSQQIGSLGVSQGKLAERTRVLWRIKKTGSPVIPLWQAFTLDQRSSECSIHHHRCLDKRSSVARQLGSLGAIHALLLPYAAVFSQHWTVGRNAR